MIPVLCSVIVLDPYYQRMDSLSHTQPARGQQRDWVWDGFMGYVETNGGNSTGGTGRSVLLAGYMTRRGCTSENDRICSMYQEAGAEQLPSI